MRLIDADKFNERVRVAGGFAEEELTEDFKDGVLTVLEMLKTEPSADVVEVVRCKDCKYFLNNTEFGYPWCERKRISFVNGFDYCSYAERRNDEQIH